jgi:hypothetical protein
MELRSGALCRKQILCVGDGRCLGYADELLLSCSGLEAGREEPLSPQHPAADIRALVVRGRPRWLGLLGRDPDLLIPWEDVLVIGEDAILIRGAGQEVPPEAGFDLKENFRRLRRRLPGG